MARAFLLLGSNLDPEHNVPAAVNLLAQSVKVVALSTFYETTPVGSEDQPSYWNGVLEVCTNLPPERLKLEVLRRVEAQLGRVRTTDKYAARTIDLDLLLYENETIESPDLILPDPDLETRAFLAVPLAELAPELAIPGSGRTMAKVASRFRDHGMRPLSDFTARMRAWVATGCLPAG